MEIFDDHVEFDGIPVKSFSKRKFHELLNRSRISNNQDFENLIRLNFLKDAYRIDVALQFDAVFITNDHFAFLWYAILCRWHRLPAKGIFLCPEDAKRAVVETVLSFTS